MYINGSRAGEKTITITAGGVTLDLGSFENGMQFKGRLSNVLVFEKALSEAGITELYGKYSTSIDVSASA